MLWKTEYPDDYITTIRHVASKVGLESDITIKMYFLDR